MTRRPYRLLFVCSGNICRSPMAHGMARDWGPTYGLELEVLSAGTLQLADRAAAPKATGVCAEIGVDISEHASQGLTTELVRWADRICVMELAHAQYVRNLVPDLPEHKLLLMGAYVGKAEIADPIGSWTKGPFRVARDEIRTGVQRLLEELPSVDGG